MSAFRCRGDIRRWLSRPFPIVELSRYYCVSMSVGPDMRRRDFLGLVGGALVAGTNSARAQQGSRRVEVLMGAVESSSSRGWVAAFSRRLDELGWRDGHNLVVHVQWWNDRPEQMRN